MKFLSQSLTPQPVIEAFKKDIDRTLNRRWIRSPRSGSTRTSKWTAQDRRDRRRLPI